MEPFRELLVMQSLMLDQVAHGLFQQASHQSPISQLVEAVEVVVLEQLHLLPTLVVEVVVLVVLCRHQHLALQVEQQLPSQLEQVGLQVLQAPMDLQVLQQLSHTLQRQ
jgi:hypothetical protein